MAQMAHTDMGVSAADYKALPSKVKAWCNKAHYTLQHNGEQRAMDTKLPPAPTDKADAAIRLIDTRLERLITEAQREGGELRLHDMAQTMLARGVFDLMKDGKMPVAYAHRAVWGLLNQEIGVKQSVDDGLGEDQGTSFGA